MRRSLRLGPMLPFLTGLVALACERPPETAAAIPETNWRGGRSTYFDVSADGQWALHADTSRRLLRSPAGGRVAYFVPGHDTLFAGPAGALEPYAFDGTVTGIGWVPHGDLLYALVLHSDGLTSLDRINVETGAVRPLKEALNAPSRSNSVAVSPDARTVYLALESDTLPAGRPADARHDSDIYALDLATGGLHAITRATGDDFHPLVVGGVLYWTHDDQATHRKLLLRLPL